MSTDKLTTSPDEQPTLNVPLWTEKIDKGKVGRDHLGLGSVSSAQILLSLVPGINVITTHPRYYSFYSFILHEFWIRDHLPRTRAAWKAFYRPREFIFSLGGQMCPAPEHGDTGSIIGGLKTGPLAQQQRMYYDTGSEEARTYIVSPFGGYGLYYRTVMAQLGLVILGGPGLDYAIDAPTPALGRETAAAFRSAVADTEYYQSFFDKDECEIPTEVIQEYISKACVCQLQTDAAPDREILRRIILTGGLAAEAEARSKTIRLFLDIARQTDGHAIDQDNFRQLIFYGKSDAAATYNAAEEMQSIYTRWRLYQAREYYAYALDAMWDYLCRWGLRAGGHVRPVALAQFWDHLESETDWNELAKALGLPNTIVNWHSDVRDLFHWIQEAVGPDAGDFDLTCRYESSLNENRLYTELRGDKDARSTMVTGMLTILALIWLRFGTSNLRFSDDWQVSKMGSNGRLSVEEYLRDCKRRLNRGPLTIGQWLRWLYEDYIILQHQLISRTKMPDHTFRFIRSGDMLEFFDLGNSVGFQDSRYNAIAAHIHELGWCGNLHDESHPLTKDGAHLLGVEQ